MDGVFAARSKAQHLMTALDVRYLFKRRIVIDVQRTSACVNWESRWTNDWLGSRIRPDRYDNNCWMPVYGGPWVRLVASDMRGASRVRATAILQGSGQVNGNDDTFTDADMCDTAHDRMRKLGVKVNYK